MVFSIIFIFCVRIIRVGINKNFSEKNHGIYFRVIGYDLIRLFMAFEVLIVHLWNGYEYPYMFQKCFPFSFFNQTCLYAVPVFFILSFALINIDLLHKDNKYFAFRMYRLFIPHLFWTFIYFIVCNFKNFIFGEDFCLTFTDLIVQLCTGHCYNNVMWFQVDLILITFFVWLVFRLKNKYIPQIVFAVVFFACVVLQYSGLNYYLFSTYTSSSVSCSIGRICEVLPAAIVGIFINKFNIQRCIYRYRIVAWFVFIPILILNYAFPLDVKINGFAYSGLDILVPAVLYVFIFQTFVINKNCKLFKYIIRTAACCPFVFYCQKLWLYCFFNEKQSLFMCFVIYFILIVFDFFILRIVNNKYIKPIFS